MGPKGFEFELPSTTRAAAFKTSVALTARIQYELDETDHELVRRAVYYYTGHSEADDPFDGDYQDKHSLMIRYIAWESVWRAIVTQLLAGRAIPRMTYERMMLQGRLPEWVTDPECCKNTPTAERMYALLSVTAGNVLNTRVTDDPTNTPG